MNKEFWACNTKNYKILDLTHFFTYLPNIFEQMNTLWYDFFKKMVFNEPIGNAALQFYNLNANFVFLAFSIQMNKKFKAYNTKN